MAPDKILLEAEDKMIKTEQVVINEWVPGVRTGRASRVVSGEHPGGGLRLDDADPRTGGHHHAGTAPARSSSRGTWAASRPIEKAASKKANLGLSAGHAGQDDPSFCFPELSAERRQEFVKITKKMAEDGRVAIRHVRRDALEELKKAVKAGDTSEEEQEKTEKEIQKLTDQYCSRD